jgi:hypothetical protein
MSEPKSIDEVPSWVIVNALKCPVDSQISIVAKLLQHLDREQRDKALSMSGVSVCSRCKMNPKPTGQKYCIECRHSPK